MPTSRRRHVMCPAPAETWNRSLSQHVDAMHAIHSLRFGKVRESIVACQGPPPRGFPPPRTAEAKVSTAGKPMTDMLKVEAQKDPGTFRPLFSPWSMLNG